MLITPLSWLAIRYVHDLEEDAWSRPARKRRKTPRMGNTLKGEGGFFRIFSAKTVFARFFLKDDFSTNSWATHMIFSPGKKWENIFWNPKVFYHPKSFLPPFQKFFLGYFVSIFGICEKNNWFWTSKIHFFKILQTLCIWFLSCFHKLKSFDSNPQTVLRHLMSCLRKVNFCWKVI